MNIEETIDEMFQHVTDHIRIRYFIYSLFMLDISYEYKPDFTWKRATK